MDIQPPEAAQQEMNQAMADNLKVYIKFLEEKFEREKHLAKEAKKDNDAELVDLNHQQSKKNLAKYAKAVRQEYLEEKVDYIRQAIYAVRKFIALMATMLSILDVGKVANWANLMFPLLAEWKAVADELRKTFVAVQDALASRNVPGVLKDPTFDEIKSCERSSEGWTDIHTKMVSGCGQQNWQVIMAQQSKLISMKDQCRVSYNNWKAINYNQLITKSFETVVLPDNNHNAHAVEHNRPEIAQAPAFGNNEPQQVIGF